MTDRKISIFFDESGKNSNDISLMGGVSVPNDYYFCKDIQFLNQQLQRKTFRMHFTQYDKSDYSNFKMVIQSFLKLTDAIQVNIISYKLNNLKDHILYASMKKDMLYSRLPERVIYGLLRNYSNMDNLKADIYIENSNEYAKLHIDKSIKKQMNIHSLYRYDNFKIENSKLVPKNQEIGIEFTDTILGIIRLIIQNSSLTNNNQEIKRSLLAKNLLINDLMDELEPLLKSIKIYELTQNDHLKKINFETYLRFYKANINSFKETNKDDFYDLNNKMLPIKSDQI
ncbi:hypothetical protein [Xylocopilactobacillus apis]|uniref:DUF3800 domain-containing protein n=1 Tax=Xylocopilactobacillus apis TaxID=2932183 RepID=A0AAU9D0K4_9LACO|nr:hypothetical protein [Xylocopilactobacillus apis]BDR57189.1 hypothetical protein KIMC2_17510 [Xylocopilactobacillus apis]